MYSRRKQEEMSNTMLISSLLSFCERNESYRSIFNPFLEQKNLSSAQRDTLLGILQDFLKDPRFTKDIAECFSHILLILLTSTIPLNEEKDCDSKEVDLLLHRINCSILGKLVHEHPDVLRFTLRYFELYPAPFSCVGKNVISIVKNLERMEDDSMQISDYDIVLASFNILKAKPNHFKHKWKWSEFYPCLTHREDKVKWIAWMCLGNILDMSESLRLKCAQSVIDSSVVDKFLIESKKQGLNITVSVSETASQEVDLIVEKTRSVISVSGVLLPILNNNWDKLQSSLVPVPSLEENLRSLALAVATGRCVCVQGAVGCGKTSIIEYLAQVTGRGQSDFIRVQLGDQTDSKIMLGTYRCTEIPGEFVWQPGILTRAVVTGKWLLLEDIDSATLDVASTLSSLLETGTLSVPGHRDLIHAKSGFQLFVTQRLFSSTTGFRKPVSTASNMLAKHWNCVNMEPFSKGELIQIIETLFPKLNTVASRMVEVFLLFQSDEENDLDYKTLTSRSGRLISTRDLIKWCSRTVVYYDGPMSDTKKEFLFQDAIDIFCFAVADEEKRRPLIKAVGHKLGFNKIRAETFCHTYKPSITSEIDFVAGRAKLLRKKLRFADVEQMKLPYSFTRPSACLLERITCCVAQKEPVLLVGETGTGKTSSIQYLAQSTGNTLIVINMNQQSESVDLLGGYKPVDLKFLIKPIREEFEILFRSYFAVEPNKKYLECLAQCYKEQKWDYLLKLMTVSTVRAVKRLKDYLQANEGKGANIKETALLNKWEKLFLKLEKLSSQAKAGLSLGFAFVEGSLVKAIQEGYWVLLDEINLANAETLECLSGLLEGSSGSLSLLERGDEDSIKRHPDFTLFACMNPATDVGKKELPVGLRNRFTEFYVDELTSKIDLQLLVDSYLRELNLPISKHEAIVKFYLSLHKEANMVLNDGTMNKPHYSLRTLCRALSIAASNACGNSLRTLYEALCLSFLTQLDHKSYPIVQNMIAKSILDKKTAEAIIRAPIPKPKSIQGQDYINFEGYWVPKGTAVPGEPKNYILTPSVKRNLKDIVRAVSIGKMPILLQGDTSVGKTSLITYLAKASGHVCVRINNHEHTDLQEYVGSYVADETGKLIFREGILVEAMRKGYWIILDELNLAPSDVLEALNRVLDDNRELFIPETQLVVKAHNNFMLFATQNPPGLYGGRKVLSRAFRNRFVELHFDEIPAEELEIILEKRCSMPQSSCKQIIKVMKDLQIRRKTTAAFAGKKGFITLRDLFRWGERYRLAPDVGQEFYDWRQHLADEGYLVLAAKVRLPKEEEEIREVIKKHLGRVVKPQDLFTLTETTSPVTKHILEEIQNEDISNFKHIVWTYNLRRMAVLLRKSCQFKEPVLLVGETGCGKTTVCQLVAAIQKQKLHVVNCHMHTESSDFLGNLRPVRNQTDENNQKFFEWVDGPLIHAMRNGDLFLADEISLADDSVLERLNSLLEPERTLVLTEKGIDLTNLDETDSIIVANERLFFVGTMNPGGDYGKKELSPALRNRFTEIWCHPCTERDDLKIIIEHNLEKHLSEKKPSIALCILNFVDWIATSELFKNFIISARDILSWVNFINIVTGGKQLPLEDAILQGACLTYTDGLGSNTSVGSSNQLDVFKSNAFEFLTRQVEGLLGTCPSIEKLTAIADLKVHAEELFGIEPFFIEKGPDYFRNSERFTFMAPTTKLNTLKLLRAMQIKKPILLEGSPGVGKTSLVSAVAKTSGHSLFRINLSDQTDVCDLFGTDLPVEGGKGGEFSWRDGPFLRALRAGHWILLDELNLASQAVLESLNACFDHRGELFIPELGKTFFVKPGTKFFACQNPMRQGGARRGLPKSFLNRFTQVYVSTLTEEDLKLISTSQFPELPPDLVHKMVDFNSRMSNETGILWGVNGSPWEMNLRDVIRWCEATISSAQSHCDKSDMFYNPGSSVELIYVDRMRTEADKEKVREIYREVFPVDKYVLPPSQPIIHVTNDKLYFGDTILDRNKSSVYEEGMLLLRDQMKTLKSLAQCINMNWMSILVGGPGSGKSSVVRVISQLAGQKLKTVVVNSAMDTNEILGGFEQTDYKRHLEQLFEQTENFVIDILKAKLSKDNIEEVRIYHSFLEDVRNTVFDDYESMSSSMETKLFLQKLAVLSGFIFETKKLGFHLEVLDQIVDKLEHLSSIVKQESCLNAGGKFEWVDSLLVKCLQDGSWLLVDQVNFCSPALLDRLNGLLEPNGVLTIGERGTGIDGNIMTIKPHKNFRLFLAMDPRYGEISRAMRNRGIEIYLLDRQKTFSGIELDVRSMLFNSGLISKKHQDTLLEIHDKISQDVSTTETLNVIQLLQSAFLISQQISRGFPLVSSFESSCENVYLKARAINQQQTKERLVSLIRESLNRLKNPSDLEEKSVDLSTITWPVIDFLENSKLAVIKREGVLLSYCIDFMKLGTKLKLEDLMKFFNLDHLQGVKSAVVDEMLPFLLLDFYEKSSKSDVDLRNQWLVKQFENAGIGKSDICEKLRKEVTLFEFEYPNEGLPWDVSQLPRPVTMEVKDKCFYDANRLALLLYWKITDEVTKKEPLSEWSLKRYSTEVLNRTVTPLFKDHPFITYFTAFTNQVRRCIDSLLREESLTLKAPDYVQLRRNLKWYKRYSDLGNLLLKIENFESSSNNLSEISLLLKVHYKWIVKFIKIFITMFTGLSKDSKNEMDSLFQIIDDINQRLFSRYDPVVKIAKKVKASMCLPLPHPSEIIAGSFSKLATVSHYLLPWKTRGQQEDLEKHLVALMSSEGLNVRRQLLSFWYTFFTTNSFEEGIDGDLLKAEEFCVKNHLDLKQETPVEEESNHLQSLHQIELAELSANLQMWPFYEYMFRLLTCRIQRLTFEKVFEGRENCNVTTQLWQKWAEIPSVPIEVLAISNAIFVRNEDSEKISRLVPVLTYLLAKITRKPCAINYYKRISHWEGVPKKYLEDSKSITNSKEMENSNHKPELLNLILELLLNKSQDKKNSSILAIPSLGAHEARIIQLKKLKTLLWRNSISFNSEKFDSLSSDEKILFICSNQFLSLSERVNFESELGDLIKTGKNPLTELKEVLQEIKSSSESELNLLQRGKAWTLLGYLQTLLFTSLGYIDPLYKVDQKLRYAEEDIRDFKSTIYTSILQSRLLGDAESLTTLHPRFVEIETTVNQIIIERDALQAKKAFRPSDSTFLNLTKDFENFRNTLGSCAVIRNHIHELTMAADSFLQNKNPNIKIAESVVRKTETWRESLDQFIDRIESRFLPSYPDLVLPAFAALSDMKRGICMMVDKLEKLISIARTSCQDSTFEGLIEKLVSYPTIGPKQLSLLEVVNNCTSNSTRELINKNLKGNALDSSEEQLKITLSGLHELHNHILLNGRLSKPLWYKLNDLMHQIILIWKKQHQEVLKQLAGEESMYKNKAQIYSQQLLEEEEINQELQTYFPTYGTQDFNDLEIDSELFMDTEETKIVASKSQCNHISSEEIQMVQRLYSSILRCCTASDWIKPPPQVENLDYIEPLIMRFNTVGLLLENATTSLSPKLSQHLYPSLNMFIEVTRCVSQGEEIGVKQKNPFDFYKDSNVCEVSSCLQLLRNIFDKVSLFLREWPDQPTLKCIHVVIQRILNFPITSSLSRFLIGLELLLTKMKEWEENAHKGVSLFDQMNLLTQQIISWRRLELSFWKDCLNVASQRFRSQSAKWCFWLYILLESYINKSSVQEEADYLNLENNPGIPKEDELTPESLAETLHFFVSKSPLGEFEGRLELLLTFHCHAFFFDQSLERDEVLAITWNVYNYYKQFTNEVSTKINSIRSPIEKKLKDFVKITRWNDISYWAAKETIAKSHKTLLKFIKEFEKGLRENVASCLFVKPATSGAMIDKTPNRNEKNLIDPDTFIISVETAKKFEIRYPKHKIIVKTSDLHQMMTQLKNRISTSQFLELRKQLDEFIEEYMERSANLKKIEIDTTLPKPKQVSHAKSVLQQKKKALADYFKLIAHIGVSYRIGILAWKNKENTVIDLMASPLDLNAAFRNFDSEADKCSLSQWNGCETYYSKAIAEFIALNQTLSKAHEDLGPLNVERFKGYSAHMILMANEQKRTLTEKIKYFVPLRSQVSSLAKLKGDENLNLPKQSDLLQTAQNLKQLLVILQPSLDQLQLYLRACPSKSDIDENDVYDLESNTLAILNATKEDSAWEKVNSLIKDCSLSTRVISDQFDFVFRNVGTLFENEADYVDCISVFTSDHFNYLHESYKGLEGVKSTLAEIGKTFGATEGLNHPILGSIQFITEEISRSIKAFDDLQRTVNIQDEMQILSNSPASDFDKMLTDVLRIALRAIRVKNKVNPDMNSSSDEAPDQLKKNSLSEMLIKALKSNIKEMNLEDVSEKFNKILLMVHNLDGSNANLHFKAITKCLPLLEQYLLYVQFYLNEQVAALRLTCKMLHLQLTVFLDLATNGFCIPKNLDLDADADGEEGSQQNSSKGGMGLSNEEGEKDVSDRIESEDQLEEAKPMDQEEKDSENKECAEEENGINMLEDFGGEMQDIEKGENDSEKSDDEDDGDLDKEMGETKEGADQQDEEIWGKDEEEVEENDTKENSQSGRGEELDDKSMGAKENDEELPEESKKSGDIEEKEEISEMNEPDINDDQIDPYHGKQQPEIEPEVIDLPDDMNLDDEEGGEDQGKQEEDAFDIDNMKEPILPSVDETEEDAKKDETKNAENNEGDETGSNIDSEEESPSDKNVEAVPIQTEPGKNEEPEAIIEEKEEEPDQQTVPNADDTNRLADNAMQVDVGIEGTPDEVSTGIEKNENLPRKENVQESQNDFGTGRSNQGMGNTEASLQDGAQTDQKNSEANQKKKRKSPKETENRNTTLVDEQEPHVKKTKTNIQERQDGNEDMEVSENQLEDEETNQDMEYRHVDNKESFNRYAIDAATEDQVKEQATKISMDFDTEETEESVDINMLHEDKVMEEEILPKDQIQNPEQVSNSEDKSKGKSSKSTTETGQMKVDSEIQTVDTTKIERGIESAFYTNISNLLSDSFFNSTRFEEKRNEVKQALQQWTSEPSTEDALSAWNAVSTITDTSARELAEKLRLILEPTQASRLKGDYRTGKRINMRKIIPYIASQFRKDKIWLRRTKPSKRNYQIVLAIDDSSSMIDNDSKEIAFESLSLISKAMMYLEVGQLGVISFGESINVLHPLEEIFTQESGARLIQKLRFEQKKTMVGQLINYSMDTFNGQNDSVENAKLLVILSDGRGVFSEGAETVNHAIRRARLAGIFIVFIIIDNPTNKESILDIRQPVFQAGKLQGVHSYMERFPFPFYMILRDINALPDILSDALRQWFELIGNMDT